MVGRQDCDRSSTSSRSSSPARAPCPSRIACSRRCSSPTSSARRSGPPSSATARWRELLERHHAARATGARALPRPRGRHGRRRLPRDLRRAGARDPLRRAPIRDGVGDLGLELRAGLHTGECELHGEKVAGIAVHIGARVASRGRPGRGARLARPSATSSPARGSSSRSRGERELKGVRTLADLCCRRCLTPSSSTPSASPIGKRNGTLASIRADELAAQVLNGLVARHDARSRRRSRTCRWAA